MNKRLAYLEQLIAGGQADSFARYALALEYIKVERKQDALAAFRALREAAPGYLPMYLMAAQLLAELGDVDGARAWASRGLELARQCGEAQAEGELGQLLESL